VEVHISNVHKRESSGIDALFIGEMQGYLSWVLGLQGYELAVKALLCFFLSALIAKSTKYSVGLMCFSALYGLHLCDYLS
jgi:hypothetical protein